MENTKSLTPNEINPRTLTEEKRKKLEASLAAYGDISGVIFNRRTRRLVGGHQRTDIIGPDCAIDAKYFDKPDKQGTVGVGYITDKNGAKFNYREVDWPKEIEYAAMIAANGQWGDWEEPLLRQVLTLISEDEGKQVDPDSIALDTEFMEKLFKGQEFELNVQECEKKALEVPMDSAQIKALPSQAAMCQLFFTVQTRPRFLELVRKAQMDLKTPSVTDTVSAIVENWCKSKGIKAQEIQENK